jgi:hypothetical protein
MNLILRNILAVVGGVVVGGLVNMGLVMVGGAIIPAPEGADVTTMEGLKASMPLFGPQNYIFPFLAHALGTLVGAWLAAFIAASRKMIFALVIGVFFLIGGIVNVFLLPSPAWFSALDLLVAYIPMAWLGGKLGARMFTTADKNPKTSDRITH